MVDVSVIIPMYNSEKFIIKTLKSILNQTFKNFEIILIDDGSTDNTCEICEKFLDEEAFKNWCLLKNPKNSGTSISRNRGIKKAMGNYILFFDSDDLMKNDCLEKAYGTAEKTSSDITFYGYDRCNSDGRIIETYCSRFDYIEDVKSGVECLKLLLNDKIDIWTGSAVYSKDFLKKNNLLFMPRAEQEDTEFKIKTLFLAKKVSCFPETFVYYVLRPGSVIHTVTLEKFHSVGGMRRVRIFLSKHNADESIIKMIDNIKLPETYVSVISELGRTGYPMEEIKTFLKNKNIKKILDSYRVTGLKKRIRFLLFKKFPGIYFSYLKWRVGKVKL